MSTCSMMPLTSLPATPVLPFTQPTAITLSDMSSAGETSSCTLLYENIIFKICYHVAPLIQWISILTESRETCMRISTHTKYIGIKNWNPVLWLKVVFFIFLGYQTVGKLCCLSLCLEISTSVWIHLVWSRYARAFISPKVQVLQSCTSL